MPNFLFSCFLFAPLTMPQDPSALSQTFSFSPFPLSILQHLELYALSKSPFPSDLLPAFTPVHPETKLIAAPSPILDKPALHEDVSLITSLEHEIFQDKQTSYYDSPANDENDLLASEEELPLNGEILYGNPSDQDEIFLHTCSNEALLENGEIAFYDPPAQEEIPPATAIEEKLPLNGEIVIFGAPTHSESPRVALSGETTSKNKEIPASLPPREKGPYFTFSTEAIYWQTIQDNLLSSIQAKQPDSESLSHLVWIEQKFHFDPGFRVNAGGFFPYDKWHLGLSYTFLRTTSYQCYKSANPEFYMILSGHMQSLSEQVQTDWEMHFQALDLMLSREFLLSDYIAVTPQMGLKGAYPNQKWHVSYIHPTFAPNDQIYLNQTIKNSFWSIGPNLGMDFSWKLPKNWAIEIHPSWSVMYAKISSEVIYSDIANTAEGVSPNTEIHGTQNVTALIPQLEIWLGVKWTYPFHTYRRFQISLGYDLQYWWNEANLIAFIQLPQGNLMMQGATFGIHFAF